MSEHTHNHHHDHNHHDHGHDHDHEQNYISVYDEEGNESLYEILFTFHSDDYEKDYVLLYPAGTFEDDDIELMAFSYIENEAGEQGELQPLETDEEWDMIEEVLNTFLMDEDFNS